MRRNRAKKGPGCAAQRASGWLARGVPGSPGLQKNCGAIIYICCLVCKRLGSEDVRKRVVNSEKEEKEKERKKRKKNMKENIRKI